MYANPATQDNLATLRRRGVRLIEPASGRLASGAQGQGRLPDTPGAVGRYPRDARDATGR